MALESASFLNQLVAANPSGSDRVHQGDDHIRLLKAVLKATFPNLTGALTLTQDQLNGIYDHTVPMGVITLWYGADTACPAGWAVCNGQTIAKADGSGNVTLPDLRGRAAIGASADYAQGGTFGQATQALSAGAAGSHTHTASGTSAGEHSHTGTVGSTALSVSQMPAHSHGNGVADDDAGGIMWRGTQAAGVGTGLKNDGSGPLEGMTETIGGGEGHAHTINSDGLHSHEITIGADGSHTHSIAPFSVIQPSLALHYIMKI